MKKLLSLTLGVLMTLVASVSLLGCDGCNPDNEYGNKSVINVVIETGGFGEQWLLNTISRFEEATAEKSYAEGKVGTKVLPSTQFNAFNDIATSGNVILEVQTSRNPTYSQVAQGKVMSIDDWMTEENPWNADKEPIADYILGQQTKDFVTAKNPDTNEVEYFGAPAWEWFGGLVYDHQLFEEGNYYMAAPDNGHTEIVPNTLASLYLVNDANSKKSAGRDGVYGTADDGMPTTLNDFAALCLLLKDAGIEVFTLPGAHTWHSVYFYSGLWAALSSYEELSVANYFRGDVEYVVHDETSISYKNESLFPLIDSAKDYQAPVTEEVSVYRNQTGYTNNYETEGGHVFSAASRYYALAFMQFMYDNGLYASDTTNGTISHTSAQGYLYDSKYTTRRAFLIDGTYAWNESNEYGVFDRYEEARGSQDETTYGASDVRKMEEIRWWTLPATLNTPVPVNGEGNKATDTRNKQVLIAEESHSFVVNKMFEDDAETLAVAKDFMQFMLSKQELANHTLASCNVMSYDFEISDAQLDAMPEFGKTLYDLHTSAEIIQQTSDPDNSVYFLKSNQLGTSCHTATSIYYYGTSGTGIYNVMSLGTSMADMFLRGTFTESAYKALVTVDPGQG